MRAEIAPPADLLEPVHSPRTHGLLASQRFWMKVAIVPSGCWEWTAGLWGGGYGRFVVDGRHVQAHRWAYESLVGPIPVNLQLDHLCRNRRCVNPNHLEPVSNRENGIRGIGIASRALATHCKHGHEFTEENTNIRPNGTRRCRRCNANNEARRRERLAMGGTPPEGALE